MAIEICSEISPRISFSHDLNQTDSLPSSDCNRDRLDLSLLESDFDFDFRIGNLLIQELSPADELFSNGKILPVQIKKPHRKSVESVQVQSRNSVSEKKKSLKELLSSSFDDSDEKPQPQSQSQSNSKSSFWQFKRSNSLNCESSKSRSLIRSLHFLSRSYSTGSSLNQKPNLQKQPSISSRKSSGSCPNSSYYTNPSSSSSSQKPSMRKNFGSNSNGNGNGNGVRFSTPLLNLPPPYISRVTVSFFGFGSLFCNGKIKKKNK